MMNSSFPLIDTDDIPGNLCLSSLRSTAEKIEKELNGGKITKAINYSDKKPGGRHATIMNSQKKQNNILKRISRVIFFRQWKKQ